MEFWGVEVKAGECLKVSPEFEKIIHISQAALGEVKNGKGPDYVPIRMKIDGKKFVLGTLSAEDRPQIMFDLVFPKEFELSHDWKDGSIYFAGYSAYDPELEEDDTADDFSDESEEEEDQVKLKNGPKVDPTSATNSALKAKIKAMQESLLKKRELKKDKPESSEDDDDDSDASENDDDNSDEISEMEEDSSDAAEDKDSEDSDDENQDMASRKTTSGKKRPAEAAVETLVSAAKKTKLAALEKAGGKSPANGTPGSHVKAKHGKKARHGSK